jgi:putative SOS response-associated peptidase YedK
MPPERASFPRNCWACSSGRPGQLCQRGTHRRSGTKAGYRRSHARNVAIDGETTNDLFAFLTTEPNAEVGIIHLKAMPVILTMPKRSEDQDTRAIRRSAEAATAASDGTLKIVAQGVKEDGAELPTT